MATKNKQRPWQTTRSSVADRKRKSGRIEASPANQNDSDHQQMRALADLDARDRGGRTSGAFGTLNVHVSSEPAWAKLSDQKLLELPITDLELDFESTGMVEFRDQLHRELDRRGIRFKPHCWFSDDWFSPDDVPGIAVPFYLAHRRLMRLERKQMLQVEGGTKAWCMRIMRHEAGHALDTAFRLHRKRGYKEMFGSYKAPYPDTYQPKPRSKKFVFHLEPWYAQSHPAEDFAETFAVWLPPNSRWRHDYQGWPALNKLKFVDQLMERIQGQKQVVRSRAKIDPVHRINMTLGEHYQQRRQIYNLESASVYDDDLKKLFCEASQTNQKKSAAAYLQRNKAKFCNSVAEWSGEYLHNVHQLIHELIGRCRMLRLYLPDDVEGLEQDVLMMLTVQTMNYIKPGHRVAL